MSYSLPSDKLLEGLEGSHADFRSVAKSHFLHVLQEEDPGLGVVAHRLEEVPLGVEHPDHPGDGQDLGLGPLLLGRVSGVVQVWSLTQFNSVDFSQSRISESKCVFNKRTIKVCVSCS